MMFLSSASGGTMEGIGGLLDRISAFLQSIISVLESASGILDGANGFQDGLNRLLEGFGTVLDNFLGIFIALATILEISWAGLLLVFTIVSSLLSFLFMLALHIVKVYPHYKLAKNLGRKHAWVALLPIPYCDIYVLSKIPGNEPFALTKKKLKLEERTTACWIYICVDLFGAWILNVIITILQFIPGLGQLLSLIVAVAHLIPITIVAIMEFIFIKDMLNVFKENRKSNKKTAAVLAIADVLLGMIGFGMVSFGGFARSLYMYSLLKKNPLPQNVVDAA